MSSSLRSEIQLRDAELRSLHLLRGWVDRDEKKEADAATTHRPPSL
jgi:hypothetical protein